MLLLLLEISAEGRDRANWGRKSTRSAEMVFSLDPAVKCKPESQKAPDNQNPRSNWKCNPSFRTVIRKRNATPIQMKTDETNRGRGKQARRELTVLYAASNDDNGGTMI